jgi:hypothetical protein
MPPKLILKLLAETPLTNIAELRHKAISLIRALQARVAELESTALHNGKSAEHWNKLAVLRYQENCVVERERDALAAELAAARAQEPVSHRYRFTHPISGEPVWRDSSPTWNGQCVQEVQPLFAAPVPPVQEPLSDEEVDALGDL